MKILIRIFVWGVALYCAFRGDSAGALVFVAFPFIFAKELN